MKKIPTKWRGVRGLKANPDKRTKLHYYGPYSHKLLWVLEEEFIWHPAYPTVSANNAGSNDITFTELNFTEIMWKKHMDNMRSFRHLK